VIHPTGVKVNVRKPCAYLLGATVSPNTFIAVSAANKLSPVRATYPVLRATLLQPLDDAHITHGAIAECFQCCTVGGTFSGSDGFLYAWLFDNNDALFAAVLVSRYCIAARKNAGAERGNRGRAHLSVSRELLRIGNRMIAGHYIGFRHQKNPQGRTLERRRPRRHPHVIKGNTRKAAKVPR